MCKAVGRGGVVERGGWRLEMWWRGVEIGKLNNTRLVERMFLDVGGISGKIS